MFSFIKKYKITLIVALVVLIIVVVAIQARAKGDYSTVAPVAGDLIRTVKVSGKVVPQDDVSLGFEIAGTVAQVNYGVGSVVPRGAVIVELERSSLLAELAQARAELAKIDGAGTYTTKTDNAQRAVVQAIADAYTQADDAIHNRVDQVFDDPRTQNPKIFFAFDDIQLRDSINTERPLMEETLNSWKALVSKGLSGYSDSDLAIAKRYASSIAQFLDDVARAVSRFKVSAGLTQTSIDKYRTDIAVGRQNVNNAISTLISEGDKLRESLSDIPVQVARVALAESRLAKARLVAPFGGIISTQDAQVGEAVSVGSTLVRLISASYEVETYVPEVSIAGVALGNPASITLDAYGASEKFDGVVSSIDPAETVKDGVSTYKVILTFAKPDTRVRSGMTANISIETKRKSNALLIPERSVIRDGDMTSVYVLVGDKTSEKKDISVGEKDSSGNLEVLGGVTISDLLLINPPKK